MFTNSNLKTKEKLINDLSKIKCKPRSVESKFSINLNTEGKKKKVIQKQQNIIAWMIGQIENKNQQHKHIIARQTNSHLLSYILVDFQEKKELEIGMNLQPHSSLKENSGNNLIYFQGKSTIVGSEALVRVITLHK